MNARNKRDKIIQAIAGLRESQLERIDSIIDVFQHKYISIEQNKSSDIADNRFMQDFGDVLRMHHAFSREPFTKDKFEYALEKVINHGSPNLAKLARKGNPGYDISIGKTLVSLKTQADRSIKKKKLHISKFMELGKGQWGDSLEDLNGLRMQFLSHLEGYDRILSLRQISRDYEHLEYELVEIPKSLLDEARDGELVMLENSTQFPKPGNCFVRDGSGELKFQLYFDGGSERKLQIKHLQKKYCKVHGSWVFKGISAL